ncbi:threonine synthase [Hahella ganghwensis]|uniref:threonine synthase n=1 Tax=Hahella ganghwensis TaxID=286420 RepID=UPI00037D9001|nr:threonine synthase [Hahella ganghwensis]
MKYISTRGQAPALNFEEVLLTGLASDGGLYVPEFLPKFTMEEIASWNGLSYAELAVNIMYPFVEGCISREEFTDLVEETYAGFAHTGCAPLKQIAPNEWVMELFHGPTIAFKDYALQLLGRLVDHFLEKRQQKVAILGATSGDTGSAAIEGCRHSKHVDIFILHPHERVSEVQRRQMTTVPGENVHNLAVKGNFDDCQRMVKASFNDQSFLEDRQLVAVNSINWARIMAQIVYYFHAGISLGAPHRSVSFSVPTGNFGDIFAGYLARNMGLPVNQLVIATNQNDILHRFMSQNLYQMQPLLHTLSPSMDIVVSSNFERLLFDLYGRDGNALADLMARMSSEDVSIEDYRWKQARQLFDSHRVDDTETLEIIQQLFEQTEEIMDPHTAIGVAAARACRRDIKVPMVTLATAHAAKFPEAVKKAGVEEEPKLPHHMADLFEREERFTVVENDLKAVQDFVREHLT